MTQKPDNPQALADKVARVKERMKQAEPYREIWSNEFHVIDQQNAIIQKQREVLGMAREGLVFSNSLMEAALPEMKRSATSSVYSIFKDAIKENRAALTAIDNVMNK